MKRRIGKSGIAKRGFPALLPNLLTTGNLAAGFYAIVTASSGRLDEAAAAIFIAMVFDFLDGRVARMARVTSRFGMEYDTIADTVSFGVAPAMVAFGAGNLEGLGWTGWVLAFIYTACAALRLARFNLGRARFKEYFEGLPSPMAAGTIASFVWLKGMLVENGINLEVPVGVSGLFIVLIGFLMVNPIPYRNFKAFSLRRGHSTTVLAVVGLAVVGLKPSVTFPLIGILYVLSGPVEWFWRWKRGRVLETMETGESRLKADEELHHE